MSYIYLYGMVLATQHIRIKGEFPKADTYCEIEEKYYGIGGETGTAAVILNSLGCRIKLAGSHLGRRNKKIVRGCFSHSDADLSELVDEENFDGVEDMVIIGKSTRTCFGQFGGLYAGSMGWVEKPVERSVLECSVVGCDPFFGEEIAQLCVKHNKKYAVIDCGHDSYFNRHCAVNAVSHEFLEEKYPKIDDQDLFRLYTDNTDGLVIFTRGAGEIMYGRKGSAPRYFRTYKVDVASTLGAGDSFKAGTIYGLNNGFDDVKLVAFAAATAAYSCSHYPIPENPATLDDVNRMIAVNSHS